MDVDVAVLSDEQLVVELTTWAGRVAAGEALVLRLIGELDARQAWAQCGVLSSAHWVSWRLGLTLATARERVRVARCLRGLPLLTAQLTAGAVSYAQARAISRVATGADEQRWVELARVTTAAQLEKAVRGVGRARRPREPAGEQPESVRISWEEDGTLLLSLRIAPCHAPAVLAALESARLTEQTDRDGLYADLAAGLAQPSAGSAGTPDAPVPAEPYHYVEPPYPPARQRVGLFDPPRPQDLAAIQAWTVERDRRRALRDAARAWEQHLQAKAVAAELPAPRATLADAMVRALTRPTGLKPVTVKLLIDPATGWARTATDELLPPTTLQQVLRTLPGRQPAMHARPLTPADLQQHDLGRQHRLVSPALRALLGQLDGERCRFPSCDRSSRLHAHHITFWAAGGRTDLANDVLLCGPEVDAGVGHSRLLRRPPHGQLPSSACRSSILAE